MNSNPQTTHCASIYLPRCSKRLRARILCFIVNLTLLLANTFVLDAQSANSAPPSGTLHLPNVDAVVVEEIHRADIPGAVSTGRLMVGARSSRNAKP